MAHPIFAPRGIDDLLANPDIGWETFHIAAQADPALPAWLPSSIFYARYRWNRIEPTRGDYTFSVIEQDLASAGQSGQALALRVNGASTNPTDPYHPAWLGEIGGRMVWTQYEDRTVEVPDLDDPTVLAAKVELIRQLGRRYDGDARVSHVDIGSVGWWGEWHMSGSTAIEMPSARTRRTIVDAYLAAFQRTPLVMLIGGGEDLMYAVSQGSGWRADCLGDLGGVTEQWCHMRTGYPQWFAEARLRDAWKGGLVAYESCWDMRRWVREGWPLRYIFNYALATHASVLNNKSAPLPEGPEVRSEIERFVRRLGYRIVLREARFSPADGAVRIDSTWQNIGSAPIYRPAEVVWELRPTSGDAPAVRFGSSLVPGELMPGDADVFTNEFMAEPPELPDGPPIQATDRSPGPIPPGEYDLRVGLLYGQADPRPIQLAIAGRDEDGWYSLGKVVVPPASA